MCDIQSSLSETRKHWDDLYREFGSNQPWTEHEMPQAVEFWLKIVGDCNQVLDIGCGDGRHSLAFAARCRAITGIDISPTAIKMAQENAIRMGIATAQFLEGDAISFEKDGEFDVITDFSFLHHVSDDRLQEYVETKRRSLKTGGILCCACYSEWDVRNAGPRVRVGSLGNPIYHRSRSEILKCFGAFFKTQHFSSTYLGETRKHHAHSFVLEAA